MSTPTPQGTGSSVLAQAAARGGHALAAPVPVWISANLLGSPAHLCPVGPLSVPVSFLAPIYCAGPESLMHETPEPQPPPLPLPGSWGAACSSAGGQDLAQSPEPSLLQPAPREPPFLLITWPAASPPFLPVSAHLLPFPAHDRWPRLPLPAGRWFPPWSRLSPVPPHTLSTGPGQPPLLRKPSAVCVSGHSGLVLSDLARPPSRTLGAGARGPQFPLAASVPCVCSAVMRRCGAPLPAVGLTGSWGHTRLPQALSAWIPPLCPLLGAPEPDPPPAADPRPHVLQRDTPADTPPHSHRTSSRTCRQRARTWTWGARCRTAWHIR